MQKTGKKPCFLPQSSLKCSHGERPMGFFNFYEDQIMDRKEILKRISIVEAEFTTRINTYIMYLTMFGGSDPLTKLGEKKVEAAKKAILFWKSFLLLDVKTRNRMLANNEIVADMFIC